MLKKRIALLVLFTAVCSTQATAGTTNTEYCAVQHDATWYPDYDWTRESCGTNCYEYYFGMIYASNVDGVECQTTSDTEYYSFEWAYSTNDGSSWNLGEDQDVCSWQLGEWTCTATETAAYNNWSWRTPPVMMRFRYKYTSGGSTFTRYFFINQIIK
jgi:hypothetical protein